MFLGFRVWRLGFLLFARGGVGFPVLGFEGFVFLPFGGFIFLGFRG